MSIFDTLIAGSGLFFTPLAILLTLVGCLAGLIIGVLPGLGPLMGIVLMMPVAFYLPPIPAMGMLIAIFVGGSCGGAISAIVLRIPGTPLAAATLLDGYPMAQRGRAGDAIGLAVSSSALGGIFGGIVLIFFAPVLAGFALRFAPPEYFALALLGLICIAVVSQESTIKGFLTGALGLLLATIGTDSFSQANRFTFGQYQLLNGFHIVAVVVGLFALSEMFLQVQSGRLDQKPKVQKITVSFNSLFMALRHKTNLLRSSTIGTFFGALPGAGGVMSSFTAYAVAKANGKSDVPYGQGAEGGVVATESANNSACGGTLIPTLALAIPGDASSAVLMGALLLLGFFPGPDLFERNPDVVGGIFIAYIFANIFLFILGILLTPVFVSVLKLKKKFLIPLVLLLCVVGVFALQSSVFDLWVMFGFGVLGYVLRKFNYPLAPIVIGLILGPIAESNFRRSLLMSDDGAMVFFDRPVSALIMVVNVLLIILVLLPDKWRVWKTRVSDI